MSTPMTMTNCPSEETLAEFIDGRLTPEARRRVVEHISACADCYSIVSAAWDYRSEDASAAPAPVVRGRFGSRRLYAAALAAAAVAVIFIATPLPQYILERDSMVLLARRSRDLSFRPAEARLSGDFAWQPRKKVTRGENDDRELSLEIAANEIRLRAEKNPSSANLHARAVAHLMLGEYDDAIRVQSDALRADAGTRDLQTAISTTKSDAFLLDLAAMYHARGTKTGKADDVIAGFDLSQAVLKRDAGNAKAVFNAALALDWLDRAPEASKYYKRYLSIDPDSPWAVEVRERLARLEDRSRLKPWSSKELAAAIVHNDNAKVDSLAGQHQQRVRYWIEDELLPQWGEAWIRGESSSAGTLHLIAGAGKALQRTTGDATYAGIAQCIVGKCTPEERMRVARASAAFGRGRSAGTSSERALEMQTAADLYGNTSAPLSALSGVAIASSHYTNSDFPVAVVQARNVLSRNPPPSIAARAHWIQGMAWAAHGEPRLAVEAYERALRQFEILGDREGAASIHLLLAELLGHLGEKDEAWTHRRQSLESLASLEFGLRSQLVLSEIADAAFLEGWFHAAAWFQTAAAAMAERLGDDGLLVYALVSKSLIVNALHASGADEILMRAERAAGRIEDPAEQGRARADILTAEGICLSASSPKESVARLLRARAMSEKAGRRIRLPQLRLAAARAYLTMNDDADAERELRAGIQEWLRVAATLDENELRGAYFGTTEELFDQLVSLLVRRGDEATAFQYAQLRREMLRPRMDADVARQHVLSRSEIQRRLPRESMLVVYEVLSDQLLVWRLSSGAHSFQRLNITRQQLKQMVVDATGEIRATGGGRSLQMLSDLLLRPEDWQGAAGITIFAPDEALYSVPFAALRDPVSRQPFVIRSAALVAPTVHGALDQIESGPRGPAYLIVSASGGVTEGGATTDYLASVSHDTSKLAASVNATVLSGRDATVGNFLRSIPKSDIVHFSGHGTYYPGRPAASVLHFSSDGDSPSTLSAETLAQLPQGRTRLIVLAACDTVRNSGRNEVVPNVASAFVTAGIHSAVGALWDVGDESAARFFQRFYAELARCGVVSTALRNAQLALLRGERGENHDWAAFELLGTDVRWST